MDDLSEGPVETLDVKSKPAPDGSKVKDDDFSEQAKKLLSDKKNLWRSSEGLAEALKVDAVQLDKWLRSQQDVLSRPGQKEGVFFYALRSRLERPASEAEAKIKQMMSRPIVTEEDRYAIAILHMVYVNLHECLDKYALRISDRAMEAFTNLLEARNRLEAGITLYTQTTKANLKKLPRL